MMKRLIEENRYNYFLFGVVILLLCFGLIMVYSASHHVALKKYDDGSLFFRKHFYRVLAGLIVLVLTALIPYKMWLRSAKLWLLLGIGFLVAVLVIGESHGAARRWIRIYGFQFQPVDFVRLAIIFYLTDAMVRKQEYLDDWKVGILPQFIVLGLVSVLLLKQPDMGSVVILFIISAVILGKDFS